MGETLGSTPLSAADFEKALRDALQKSAGGRSARVLQHLEEQRAALSEEIDDRVHRLFKDHVAQHVGTGTAEARVTFFQQKLTKGIRTAIVAKRLLEQTDAPEFEALRHAMIVPGDLLPDGTTHLKLHSNPNHTKKVNGPIFGVGFDGSRGSGAPAQAAGPSAQPAGGSGAPAKKAKTTEGRPPPTQPAAGVSGVSGAKKAKTAKTATATVAALSDGGGGLSSTPPAVANKRPATNKCPAA